MPRYGKGTGGPWYGEDRQRILFERGARARFPGIRCETLRPGGGRVYRLTVEVPHFDNRLVQISFRKKTPSVPRITADGPSASPHRYADNDRCVWEPDDPEDRRWVVADGLLELIGLIMCNLFREAYWRLTGEWVGPEAAHGQEVKRAV